MTPEKIIQYCQAHNITLEPTEKGTIIIDVPDKSLWSNALTESISKYKKELISILRVQHMFNEKIVSDCENNRCFYQCLYMGSIDKCPYHLPEGTYRWNDNGWKGTLH
jgi:hypothetical protein